MLPLFCHPNHPISADCTVDSLSATVQFKSNQLLQFHYSLHADLNTLRIPYALNTSQPITITPHHSEQTPNHSPDHPFMDNLWQHTCFEAFIYDAQGSGAYYEFNFSPNGAWAAYAFSHYRQRSIWQPQHFPVILTQQSANHLNVTVSIPPRLFTLNQLAKPLLGLSAVLENHRGEYSWWALNHPCEQPDFHHQQSFTYAIRS